MISKFYSAVVVFFQNREEANIRQQDIQPGGMKVWSDPFDRDVKPKDK